MKKEYEVLVGALIGLARATDGNEHLINPTATAVIRMCLSKITEASVDTGKLLESVDSEKRKMVPNCFTCANPCGRTSAFDFSDLPEGEIRDLKMNLLDLLCHNAATVNEEVLYRDLIIIGLDDYTREDLLPMIEELA